MASPVEGGAGKEMGEDNMEDENSSEESSDSDDSDFEVDVSVEDMASITKLETDLAANPNLYDVHLQVLIKFYIVFHAYST